MLRIPYLLGGLVTLIPFVSAACSSDDSTPSADKTSAAETTAPAGGSAGAGNDGGGGDAGDNADTGGGPSTGAGGGGAGGTESATPSASTGGSSAGGSSAGGSSAGGSSTGGSGGEGGSGAGTLELEALTVAGVDVLLKPNFDPERRRYSVRASDPADELSVTATADTGLSITVAGLPAASGEPIDLPDATPGSEIEVEVSDGNGDSGVYTVLYLPADFPDFQVTVHEPEASNDPIYLASRMQSTFYVVKLDNYGVPLFYRSERRNIYDFKKHPGGVVSYARHTGTERGAQQVLLDDNFDETGTVSTVGLTNTDQHEFLILENGNHLLLAYEPTEHDLTPFGGSEAEIVDDGVLQEVGPNDEVLFQWSTWDHMPYDESLHLEGADYAHINSVVVAKDGDWIVSSRGMSQVLKIDRDTGDVLWRLGGISNDFEFINDEFGGLCGQHTASELENGHIMVFDNGQYCWPEVPERGRLTRIVEYAIDEVAMTAELVWSYSDDDIYASSQGSAQRLPTGNTFIGWGGTNQTTLVTEVNPAGEVVFSMDGIDDARIVSNRARRFAD